MVYVYSSEAEAKAIRMTLYYLGYEALQIGSAILCEPKVYEDLIDKTMAPKAAIVAEQKEVSE